MSTVTETLLTAERVREASQKRGEPAFLTERRLKALASFHEQPMPGRRDELWRRIRLPEIATNLEAAAERAEANPAKVSSGDAKDGFWGTAAEAARKAPKVLEAYWATKVYPAGAKEDLIQRKGGKYHALNQALFDSGYVLHLAKGIKIEQPFTADLFSRPSAGAFPHNLIVLEEGAEAVVIENHISKLGDAGLFVPQTEVIVGPGARLRYVLLQDLGNDVVSIGAQRVQVYGGGHVTFASANLGGSLCHDFIECEMMEPRSEAILYGLYYGLDAQEHHLTTYQHHRAENCHSDLMFKGALDHRARACWRGMIRLEPHAQQTDAYQQNRTLLLSDDARIHSIPGLEILANDVKCSHGSTAGQIDPTMLFYLLSRGISQFQARKMIMDGFFEEVVLKFGLESVIEPLRAKIDAKIAARGSEPRP